MMVLTLLLCAIIFHISESGVSNPRRTCFYDGWAAQRQGIGTFTPDMIDPFLCTHIIFAYATVRPQKRWSIYRRKVADVKNYKALADLKTINPELKTLIMLSENVEGDLDNMAQDATNRTTFVDSIIPFMKTQGFDGFCLQWKGNSEYFKSFSETVRGAFDAEYDATGTRFLFIADLMGPTLDKFNSYYNLNTIKEVVASNFDFITLQSYALYEADADNVATHHSRRVSRSTNTGLRRFLNMKSIGDYFNYLGVPKSSMDIGIATYGRGYTLANSSDNGVGASISGLSVASNDSAILGFRGYYEICEYVENGNGMSFVDEGVPFFVQETLWIGYDDVMSVTEKATWAYNEGYGGAAIWSVALDDFNQNCNSSGRPFPLLNAVKDAFDAATTPPPPKEYRRVCYYTLWSANRTGPGQFTVNEVDPFLCTHVIVAFLPISNDADEIDIPLNISYYQEAVALKNANPDLKVLFSVGGWAEGSARFSYIVSGPKRRRSFASSLVDFMNTIGFDGIDISWQYPTQRHGARPDTDKKNFAILLKVIRNELLSRGFNDTLLTIAVAAAQENIDYAYDFTALANDLSMDFISILTFDMHGYWDEFTGHHSMLKPLSWETGPDANLNTDWAARFWEMRMRNVNKNIINIGVATYGRGFELSYAPYNWSGAYHDGPNAAGNYTNEEGFLAYYEICPLVASGDGAVEREGGVPHYVKDTLWIGYDDEQSVRNKMQWLINNDYGGVTIWAMDLDDFRQTCASSLSPSPLINTIKDTLLGLANNTLTTIVTDPPTTYESSTMSSTTEEGPHIDCSVVPVDGPYPNPNNSRTFYKCSHGVAYLYWCPGDLEFNPSLLVCDYP
ncbi:acidic mammalian chitinase-like [Argopecten irradians]|uniref:acidic mammalian chitinase-like n=1 Tax=Argopecten irradians TaxID=31199 RepID=UPI0037195D63